MAERIYVALDLETTGLNAKRDSIIEIGALRFQGNQILERFTTLINPRCAIPLRIQQITGISDQDVADAPGLDQVLPELMAFVRADVAALVAHNANFDLGFLRAAGVNFHRPALDTFELASVLLPRMTSYSLGELCRALDIVLEDAHRALDDATATTHLFWHLRSTICSLPAATIQAILQSGAESGWSPLQLFADCQSDRTSAFGSVAAVAPTYRADLELETRTRDEDAPTTSVTERQIADLFGVDGPLHRSMQSAYEMRGSQVEMAQRVAETLNHGDHLLIEAGTGIGKSLAYLLPALLWSVRNDQRVVVATNTIALQDQLIDKDIPQALDVANVHDRAQVALLKGRANYLCTRRLEAWRRNRRLTSDEMRVLAKILVWLPTTRTGDVSELFLPTPAERAIWQRVCSDAATCSVERCREPIGQPPQPRGRHHDFFLAARRRAEASHLLVVNHALLMADLASGGNVLPAYRHLVVDEAHHLEEAATDQLTYRVEWRSVRGMLAALSMAGELLPWMVRATPPDVRHDLIELSARAERAQDELVRFADILLNFALSQGNIRRDTGYAQRLRLDAGLRSQPLWSNLEIEWDQASQRLHPVHNLATEVVDKLDRARWRQSEANAARFDELQALAEQVSALAGWIDEIVFQPEGVSSDIVSWLEVSEEAKDVCLLAAPLYVNEILNKELLLPLRAAIFTGATLRTGSGFEFIRNRLGLWDASAATVDSPFDYRASSLLYLPSDMPEPNHARYQAAVERAIIDAAHATGGATLALFTSYAHLRTTADNIRAPLDRLGITVLQHGGSSRRRLLREYREAERAVLLGTRSFWEGVDLPGDELRCLLIVRLPFAVPSDPLISARSEEFENPFRDYMLPDAVLRFRQGFGRLIRSASDRGVVVVLDSRMWRKKYGETFLEALPKCTRRHAPLANLGSEIVKWLAP